MRVEVWSEKDTLSGTLFAQEKGRTDGPEGSEIGKGGYESSFSSFSNVSCVHCLNFVV